MFHLTVKNILAYRIVNKPVIMYIQTIYTILYLIQLYLYNLKKCWIGLVFPSHIYLYLHLVGSGGVKSVMMVLDDKMF